MEVLAACQRHESIKWQNGDNNGNITSSRSSTLCTLTLIEVARSKKLSQVQLESAWMSDAQDKTTFADGQNWQVLYSRWVQWSKGSFAQSEVSIEMVMMAPIIVLHSAQIFG